MFAAVETYMTKAEPTQGLELVSKHSVAWSVADEEDGGWGRTWMLG